MKLDQLLYFVETARFEHIGKAARSLAISPSAVSHAIANLEEELGRSLFQKKGKHIFLTQHGKELANKAKSIISEVENLKTSIESDENNLQGHFRLAGSHLISSSLLTKAWAKTAKSHPQLSCELYSLRSAQVVTGIASGEFDFGLCFSPQAHPEVDVRNIYEGQLRIAFSKHHPLAKKSGTAWLKELPQYPSTMPKAFQGVDVCEQHPTLEKHGLISKSSFVYDSYDTALQYLHDSQAWGFLPDRIIEHAKLASPSHPKDWKAPYSVSALLPRNRPMTKVLSLLIENLTE